MSRRLLLLPIVLPMGVENQLSESDHVFCSLTTPILAPQFQPASAWLLLALRPPPYRSSLLEICLTHDGSINVNDCPRLALFARWPHQHQRQVAEFRHEVPEDLWKYWAI